MVSFKNSKFNKPSFISIKFTLHKKNLKKFHNQIFTQLWKKKVPS